jgi:hypothetical protein
MLPLTRALLAVSVAPVSTTMLPLRRVPFKVHVRPSGTTTLSSATAPMVPVHSVVSANAGSAPPTSRPTASTRMLRMPSISLLLTTHRVHFISAPKATLAGPSAVNGPDGPRLQWIRHAVRDALTRKIDRMAAVIKDSSVRSLESPSEVWITAGAGPGESSAPPLAWRVVPRDRRRRTGRGRLGAHGLDRSREGLRRGHLADRNAQGHPLRQSAFEGTDAGDPPALELKRHSGACGLAGSGAVADY